MSRFSAIKVWVWASPLRKASFVFGTIIVVLALWALIRDGREFIQDPAQYLGSIVIVAIYMGYYTYVKETYILRKQAMPSPTSIPAYSVLALVIKLIVVTVLLTSVGILMIFRVENLGGGPDFRDQLIHQLLASALLGPLVFLYGLSGWKFAKTGSLTWLLVTAPIAYGLYFWNAFYAWRNPQTGIPGWYEALYQYVGVVSFVPLAVMAFCHIVWLVMLWLKLSKLTHVNNLNMSQ